MASRNLNIVINPTPIHTYIYIYIYIYIYVCSGDSHNNKCIVHKKCLPLLIL